MSLMKAGICSCLFCRACEAEFVPSVFLFANEYDILISRHLLFYHRSGDCTDGVILRQLICGCSHYRYVPGSLLYIFEVWLELAFLNDFILFGKMYDLVKFKL